jgi:hypothetical protein
MFPNQEPRTSVVDWLIPYQAAQDLHDMIYCRDVACLAPTERAHVLVTLLAKYLANIQASQFTSEAGYVTGKRVTDILITITSLLTAMKVNLTSLLEKVGVPAHVNNEARLMQWLNTNYVYELGNTSASPSDVYGRGEQFTVAMPLHIFRALDAVETIKLMQPQGQTSARSSLINAAMHLWIQCVICHHRHNHASFMNDITERLREVEQKSLHSAQYGLFPNYNLKEAFGLQNRI